MCREQIIVCCGFCIDCQLKAVHLTGPLLRCFPATTALPKSFLAGYMQSTYYDNQHGLTQKDQAFGIRLQQKTLGNLHDHLSCWKIDFDINGTSNNFHKTVRSCGTVMRQTLPEAWCGLPCFTESAPLRSEVQWSICSSAPTHALGPLT